MKQCIFTAFDDAYFPYAKACLNSLSDNFPNHPPVRVLYAGNDPVVKAYCASRNVSIIDYNFDRSMFDGFNLGVVGSPMIYARLLLWTDFLDEFEKILYLDCDTIVLKPFDEIFESDEFFCVADNGDDGVFLEGSDNNSELIELLLKDNLEFSVVNTCMINSGFFLLPRKFRMQPFKDQVWNISKRYNNYIKHSDQSVLSIWCLANGISASKDFRYNFQTHFILGNLMDASFENLKIIHFSHWKPGKNYSELLLPARYIIRANDAFEKYSDFDKVSEKAL